MSARQMTETESHIPTSTLGSASMPHPSQSPSLTSDPGEIKNKIRGNLIAPQYPRISILQREEGSALIRIQIQEGKVISLHLLQSTGYERLDQAALESIRSWQFLPEMNQVWTQKITFQLNKSLHSSASTTSVSYQP